MLNVFLLHVSVKRFFCIANIENGLLERLCFAEGIRTCNFHALFETAIDVWMEYKAYLSQI